MGPSRDLQEAIQARPFRDEPPSTQAAPSGEALGSFPGISGMDMDNARRSTCRARADQVASRPVAVSGPAGALGGLSRPPAEVDRGVVDGLEAKIQIPGGRESRAAAAYFCSKRTRHVTIRLSPAAVLYYCTVEGMYSEAAQSKPTLEDEDIEGVLVLFERREEALPPRTGYRNDMTRTPALRNTLSAASTRLVATNSILGSVENSICIDWMLDAIPTVVYYD
ncbi:hypothetical protein N7532_008397 [Penicillium argentinense]|uniref:Uncharacterized protein n=1 Tax=Penicillium argentinense TaxID=1131581 RepID=A0A9W9K1K4_9EURO|nr:uncharacterized protein N7532_008397 [Penicillium argentinense]KAJ5089713.1 hypothetical protein N7532_008397 [Penicillium argentinense]